MVDLVHARCLAPGCTKQPHFGDNKEFCKEHVPSHEDDKNAAQQCEHIGCTQRRSYGAAGAPPSHCKSHATATMFYMMKPECEHVECDALAWYGSPATPATVCARHKRSGMIDNPRQRCSREGCNHVGTYDDETRDRFCDAHAPAGARALVVTPCGACGLPDVLTIAGMCSSCDPVTRERAMHVKELRVKALLDAGGWKYESHDKMLESGACYAYRPDFVFDAFTHMVVLEVDEHQHSSYPAECERTRMLAIAQTFSMPTAFIRYNPDAFVCGMSGRKSCITEAQRHKELLRWLKLACSKIDVSGCIVVRVCYDGFATSSADWVRVA